MSIKELIQTPAKRITAESDYLYKLNARPVERIDVTTKRAHTPLAQFDSSGRAIVPKGTATHE